MRPVKSTVINSEKIRELIKKRETGVVETHLTTNNPSLYNKKS